jgi:FkbM family methyltransferase
MYNQFHGDSDNNYQLDYILRNRYFPDYNYKGTFIEIGSFDPILISNSYHFEKNGWDVFCFEANTQLIQRLKEERKNVYNYAVYDVDKPSVEFNVVLSSGWTAGFSAVEIDEDHIKNIAKKHDCEFPITKICVQQKTLNTILENELKHVNQIDILGIDVEGGELNCLIGLDLNKYRPLVILLENGGGCKPNVDNTIIEYLQKNDYVLDISLSYNLYFVDSKRINQ